MFISMLLIKKFRKEKKLTQKQLATLSGIGRSTISDIENSLKSPSLDTLDKIATALDVPTYKLFFTKKNFF